MHTCVFFLYKLDVMYRKTLEEPNLISFEGSSDQVGTLILSPEAGEQTVSDTVPETEYEFEEEKQIVIHCRCDSRGINGEKIRLWKTTYLFGNGSEYKSNLLFAFNISFYPIWDILPINTSKKFTLIFGPLPKKCSVFDLVEITDDTGAFVSKGIKRNRLDIYHIKL